MRKTKKKVLNSGTKELRITVKKTSQPLGLALYVYDDREGIFIVHITNKENGAFSIDDQLLEINLTQLLSVQDVMGVIGNIKLGEELNFDMKRSKLLLQAQWWSAKKKGRSRNT